MRYNYLVEMCRFKRALIKIFRSPCSLLLGDKKMKTRNISCIIILLLAVLLLLLCSASHAEESDYIINSYEEFCQFAKLVNEGDPFEGRNVYLTEDITTEDDFKITGVFSGTFNALGNVINSKGAVFENLSGAELKNITFCGIMLAENAENSSFDSCVLSYDGVEAENDAQSAIVKTARGCKFYNCVADLSSFAQNAAESEFINSLSKRSPAVVQSFENCTFSNILSLVTPAKDIEGVTVFDTDIGAEGIAALLNAARTDPEKENLWSVSDGNVVLHTHKHEKILTESTCQSFAKTDYVCSCGDCPLTLIDTEAGYAPHTKGEAGNTVPPTCTDGGYTEYTCALCGESFKTDETKALGHKTETVGAVAATCVSKGYTGDKVCTVCGTTVSRGKVRAATGVHTWHDAKITKEPTGDENGEITYYCTYCDATKKEVLPALGHELGEYTYFDETYHSAECSCGEIIKEEHDFFEASILKEPTADEAGEALYECRVCGAQKTVELPATGHSVAVWAPFDEEMHGGLCSCGEYETQPHDWDGGTVVSDGISDMSGLKRTIYTCGVCEMQRVVEEVVELPVIEVERFDKKTKQLVGAALLLLTTLGAAGCVYVKYSDRK